MTSAELFSLNSNAIHIFSFLSGLVFTGAAIAVRFFRGQKRVATASQAFNDLLRGASVFPLMLFALAPLMPNMGKLALSSDPVLLSIGAASGLFAILSDWWTDCAPQPQG